MRANGNWLPETKWHKGDDDKQHIDVAVMLVHPDEQPDGVALCMTDQTLTRYARRPDAVRKHTVMHRRGECGDDVEKFFDAAADVFDKPAAMRVQISGRALRDIAAMVPSNSRGVIELVCDETPSEFGHLDLLMFGEPISTHHTAQFKNAVRFRTEDGKACVAVVGAPTYAREVEQRMPPEHVASVVARRGITTISDEDERALDELDSVVEEFMNEMEEEDTSGEETHEPVDHATEEEKRKANARALRELRNRIR